MEYTILIYQDDAEFSARTDPNRKEEFWRGFLAYYEALKEAGIVVGGAGLEPPQTGNTVRWRDGTTLVQDGPYADTKEQLGGLFIIDVPDLGTALDWAARYVSAPGRVVEVRPNLSRSHDH
ncbi:MAG TPA: YciI family protein [Gemmatimonadaceae bacterium]